MAPPELCDIDRRDSSSAISYFVHLSDIHLNKKEISSGQDIDIDIRKLLKRDLQKVRDRNKLAPIRGIFVTGDISYCGDEVEFNNAADWLSGLCLSLTGKSHLVWTVPGNHDVDHVVVENDKALQNAQNVIRLQRTNAAAALRDQMANATEAERLLTPFENYNRFARIFPSCATRAPDLFWRQDLDLCQGWTLRISGLNSSLISKKKDPDPPCQVLGLQQVQFDREPGLINLTLCHHPTNWLFDESVAIRHFNSRAQVQLFGHEHSQRARREENSVIVNAGALHPDRGEKDWEPRYNIIGLQVVSERGSSHLRVLVHERAWKPDDTDFGADPGANGDPREYLLPLPEGPSLSNGTSTISNSHFSTTSPLVVPQPNHIQSSDPKPIDQGTQEAKLQHLDEREIAFDFFRMSYPSRHRVLSRLSLLTAEDERKSEEEQFWAVVARAISLARVEDLLDAIKEETSGR